ncbi:ATP-binding protein [Microbacterium sp.]|uniref:sensor histidine kinase n=1 Tax=Microbacterium sp. TaxID=51671 RepID=UPI003A930982
MATEPDAVTGWWRSLSLRAKVTGVTVAVLMIGLITVGAGTLIFLRNALDANLDTQVQQLAVADVGTSVFDITIDGDDVTFTPNPSANLQYSGYFVAVYAADGKRLATNGPSTENTPVFPAEISAQEANIRGTDPFTIEGSAGPDFRASVGPLTIANRSALFTQLVALPTASVNRIIGTFLGIYSVFAILTVIVGALVTRWLVTLAFRSLSQVESTAMSIAAGDFSQRMTGIEPEHTEVGRLKIAINAMLGRLDAAIGQRDAAVRQMRRFVGDASHELRTPLVTVRGYAELYRMGAIRGDDDVAVAFERIEKEAIRMGALVEDLLVLTRLDERQETVPLVPVDLRPIARDAAMDVRAASPGRSVGIDDTTTGALPIVPLSLGLDATPTPTTTPKRRAPATGRVGTGRAGARGLLRRRPRTPPAPRPDTALVPTEPITLPTQPEPIVLGDENRIRQVVANLLANARRYTPEDSRIDLSVGVDAAGGVGWIAVADHGEGIPEQIREQIFQRFWRADTSRTRETGGSGLGLSIVASVVQALNGTVSVTETPGGGATFRVAFPLAEHRPDAAGDAADAPAVAP